MSHFTDHATIVNSRATVIRLTGELAAVKTERDGLAAALAHPATFLPRAVRPKPQDILDILAARDAKIREPLARERDEWREKAEGLAAKMEYAIRILNPCQTACDCSSCEIARILAKCKPTTILAALKARAKAEGRAEVMDRCPDCGGSRTVAVAYHNGDGLVQEGEECPRCAWIYGRLAQGGENG